MRHPLQLITWTSKDLSHFKDPRCILPTQVPLQCTHARTLRPFNSVIQTRIPQYLLESCFRAKGRTKFPSPTYPLGKGLIGFRNHNFIAISMYHFSFYLRTRYCNNLHQLLSVEVIPSYKNQHMRYYIAVHSACTDSVKQLDAPIIFHLFSPIKAVSKWFTGLLLFYVCVSKILWSCLFSVCQLVRQINPRRDDAMTPSDQSRKKK